MMRMLREDCGHTRTSCDIEFVQGDVFDLKSVFMAAPSPGGEGAVAGVVDCPEGVVVISQTCDALLSELVQVARLVTLEDQPAKEAVTGKRPRYIPVKVEGKQKFADLSYVMTVDCECLCSSRLVCHGVPDFDSQRLFRDLVSRRFGRFPFPDDVVKWCKPLREKIAPKARKESSQGELLRRVRCIRVEDNNGWVDDGSYSLNIIFLTVPGALPTIDDTTDCSVPNKLLQSLCSISPSKQAERISEYICNRSAHDLSDGAICKLWEMLANAWVAQCNEKYDQMDGHARVEGNAEVVPEDEYSFSRFRQSEQLDLDYLSRG